MKVNKEELKGIYKEFVKIGENSPLIHCITNYVTVNDVANAILAIGASPIMATAPEEIEEIVKFSSGLYINIGTITRDSFESMKLAIKSAIKFNKNVVIDAVGAGASTFRNNSIKELLSMKVDILHGNYSEINYLSNEILSDRGVDSSIDKSDVDILNISKNVSKKYNCIVVTTGEIDIVTNGKESYKISNGSSNLEKITGCGCMLSGMLGACLSSDNILLSSLSIATIFPLAGELANRNSKGLGDLHKNLFNYLSTLDEDLFIGVAKIEKL